MDKLKAKEIYSDRDIERIIDAYQSLFKPNSNNAEHILRIKNYFDINDDKKRNYSVINSDFFMEKKVLLETLKKAKEAFASNSEYKNVFDMDKKDYSELENAGLIQTIENITKYYKKNKIGSSIGINPLTDDLLYRSFDLKNKKEIIIIIAYDYYPYYVKDKKNKLCLQFNSPIEKYSMFDHDYFHQCFPSLPVDSNIEGINSQEFKENVNTINVAIKKYTFLYLNLYPDFRIPLSQTNSTLETDEEFGNYEKGKKTRKKGKCFEFCSKSIESIIKILSSNNYTVNTIITWGSNASYYLKANKYLYKNNELHTSPIELSKIIKYKVVGLESDINVFPMYHPYADKRKYFTPEHLKSYFDYLKEIAFSEK